MNTCCNKPVISGKHKDTNVNRYVGLLKSKQSTKVYINPLNYLGRIEGGLGGSGTPPRNKFN